jgi:isoleucyl-tRNA synthetase
MQSTVRFGGDMIQPSPKHYDADQSEEEVQRWWGSERIYDKVKEMHSHDPDWFFLDGPPYASGAIHLGTAWNKIIKDVILRYKGMCGFNVRRQPGWDCHGLPIEVKVEEKLKVKTKKDIEQIIGIKQFIEECKRWALDHVDLMTQQFKRLGVWMDWDNSYLTFTDDFIESAWWTLKQAHEKGLMQKDLRVIQWCPRCETALAEHEVRGEYRDVRDPSLYARFKLIYTPNEYLLIWTTTPWTLPANVAVCVNPEFNYAKVAVGDDIYIVAEPLVQRAMSELGISDYRMVDLIEGKELEGLRYEHPLLEEVPKQGEFRSHHQVICGEHVTLEEGTGCVHTAPGHGQEDFEVGAQYKLPVFSPVGPDGKFTHEAGKYSGRFVKDADRMILDDLERKGVLMKEGVIHHSYPHCWRCKTPLLFRATDQWFLRVSDIKSKVLERNTANVKWIPEWVATRYENGVESVGDWCISRQRYWGIPLPIWVCEKCGHELVVGGRGELAKLSGGELHDLDLHRPQVDEIALKCPRCEGEMQRTPDVLDVWFDSGICSWASLGYPKRRDEFERLWPSDFITEGEDQVTKWFYSQQVASVMSFGEVPYKKVLMHGFTLDPEGRKMSKSLGNVVEPLEIVEKYGADVLRFYMLSASPVWEDLRFSWKEIGVVNRMLNVLWNVYAFATTYMSLDKFDPKAASLEELRDSLEPEDRWLMSRVNALNREVTEALQTCNLHVATRALQSFVLEDLSRWYVKLIRPRTWIEREDPRKQAAYLTLYRALHSLFRLLAPLMPHVTETMYQGLIRAADSSEPESVHLQLWPEVEEGKIDEQLENDMDVIRALFEGGATARQDAGVKLRWPVRKVLVRASSQEVKESALRLESVLRAQLNTKELVVLGPGEDAEELNPVCNADLGVLSQKFGSIAPKIKNILRRMKVERVREDLERQGFVGLQVEGQQIQVPTEGLKLDQISEEFVTASTDVGEVIVDTTPTPELRAERLARELVRRLQMMRKELDLGMEERVDVVVGAAAGESRELLKKQEGYLKREVRIKELVIVPAAEVREEGYAKDWDVMGESFRLLLRRIQ